jgi:DNA helicase-4
MDGFQKIIEEINRYKRKKRLSYLLIPLIIGIFFLKKYNQHLKTLFEQLKENEQSISLEITLHIDDIRRLYQEIKNKDIYIDTEQKSIIMKSYEKHLNPLIILQNYGYIFSSSLNTKLSLVIKELLSLRKQIENFNQEYIQRKKKIYEETIQQGFHKVQKILQDICDCDIFLTLPNRNNIIKACDEYQNLLKTYRDNPDFSKILHFCINDCEQKINVLKKEINSYNDGYIKRKKQEYQWLFNKSPFPLDDPQKTAVVTDDKYNLVIAGAGAGKTEVLTTRIAYLTQRKPDTIESNRILALAFQRKASQEMKKRLSDRFGINVEIRTFHSLGLDILRRGGTRYTLFGENNHEKEVENLINDLYSKAYENSQFRNDVIKYMGLIGNEDKIKEETDFANKEEFFSYQENLPLKTLNNTEVKSFGEQVIMNFFLSHEINGEPINIRYEEPAEWMEYTDEACLRHTPHPDFYLPDFDVYIEHWSIDKQGKTPRKYDRDYLQTMKIKHEKFKKNGKTLIETTFGEFIDNPLFTELLKQRTIESLKDKYPDKEFIISPTPYKKLVEQVWDDCKSYLKKLPQNINRFITIAKTYKYTPSDIEERLKDEQWSYMQRVFGRISNTIYTMYENELKRLKCIDYCDMINMSIETLKQNQELFKDQYDHILIDEFQDISMQRYELIQTMMNLNQNCKLFCVGDDWQSIMGFSGSHLNFFVNFKEYFGQPSRTDLITNYRSIQSIVDTGEEIIKNNYKFQLQKKLTSYNKEQHPVYVFHSTHQKNYLTNYYRQICEHCIKQIDTLLNDNEKKYSSNDFMVLTRIINNPKLIEIFDEISKYYRLKIPLMSVHQSKGLQARSVFLLDVVNGLYGFPCQLEDPTIFETARRFKLEDKEAEERRLFYVAITRAKEDVFIYTQQGLESKFLNEIGKHIVHVELDWKN